MNGRVAEASRLVSEYMVLIESIGDPTLTVRLALLPIAVKISTGELAEALRWSDMVIDLAEGDPARGGYIRGSLLASAYALRCTARWALGYTGWRDDFNRAVAMARDADPLSQGVVIAYTTVLRSAVVSLPPTTLHYTMLTRRCRARSDRLTTSLSASPCTRRQSLCCIAIPRSASAAWTYAGSFVKWR